MIYATANTSNIICNTIITICIIANTFYITANNVAIHPTLMHSYFFSYHLPHCIDVVGSIDVVGILINFCTAVHQKSFNFC